MPLDPVDGGLGTCPRCGRSLPRRSHLICYRDGDWPTMVAECADCDAVVHPR